jgi:PAS domain S-box-containing protein
MAEVKVNFSRLPLSERESEILLLAAEGLTDKEISDRLGVSDGSIRTYWDRVRSKLQAKSRGEAIAKSLREAYEAALRELAETQEWARIMVECSRDYAIFRTDAEGKIMTWNPGVTDVLYYNEKEFVGMDIAKLFTEADQLAGMPEQERATAIDTGRSIDARWHVRRDGVKIWIEGTLVALWSQDKRLIGFAKIMQDRTGEYQAKEMVRRLTAERALEHGVTPDPDPPPSS